jgi:ABC-type transport system involved in multi-copper enzyme maturation permease subunit
MKWLLWKDYRNNRAVVVAALALLLLPHLSVLVVGCLQRFYFLNNDPRLWVEGFTSSTVFSLIASQLVTAVIGGNLIAGERADRSASFLASLPVTRRKILASKLLLALAIVAPIWLIDGTALFYLNDQTRTQMDFWPTIGLTAVTALVFFSVSWCLSSFLSNPMYSATAGLFTPLVLWLGILLVGFLIRLDLDNRHFERLAEYWYCGICLTLVPVCFVGGVWHYLQRVEP